MPDRPEWYEVTRGSELLQSEATMMRPYALDLPEALVQEAQAVAQAEHTSLEDFVRLAIAEKIAAARTAQYVHTRAARADPQAFLAVLERIKQAAGPVVEGDELEPDGGRTV
jgi:hypothetical protein